MKLAGPVTDHVHWSITLGVNLDPCTRPHGEPGAGAATLKRLVEELDAEIAACQATIERDQRWERRVATRYDVVDAKDNFSSGAVHEGVEDYTAGVMAVHLSADALDKGGLNRFSLAELRAALEKLGRPADGDKPTLFRGRVEADADECAAAHISEGLPILGRGCPY